MGASLVEHIRLAKSDIKSSWFLRGRKELAESIATIDKD
jgi:hypothetical protein